jgi:hypothetical protein
MSFPSVRLRRLRRTESLRRLVRETRLTRDDLVLPLFAVEGKGVREPVASMPGVERLSADQIGEECKRVADLGLPAVILFGIPPPRTPAARAPTTRAASSSAPSRPRSAPRPSSASSPTCVCASTPTTATAACSRARRSPTTRASRGSPPPPSPTPGRAPTWWRPRT